MTNVPATIARRHKALLRALREIVYDHDLPSDNIHWSGDTERVLGCTMAELGRTQAEWIDRVHPDDRPHVLAQFQKTEPDAFFETEYRFRHHDGHYVWMFDRGVISRDENGEIAGVTGLMWDISDRKRDEQAMRETTDRLQLATRVSNVGIWDVDLVTDEVIWDEAMYRLYGLSPEGVTSPRETWESCVHPEDLDRLWREIQTAFRGEADLDTEFRISWPDGSTRHIRAIGLVRRDASGRVRRLLGTNWDVTDRKRNEQALRDSERRLSLALAASKTGVWERDFRTNAVHDTPEARHIFGVDEPFESFEAFISIVHPDDLDDLLAASDRAFARGDPYAQEFRVRRPDGEVRWVSSCGQIHHDESGEPVRFVGTVADITERKQAEDALRQRSAELEGIFRAFPDLFFRLGADGAILDYLSSADSRGLYRSPAEFLGKRIQDVLPPTPGRLVEAALTKTRASGRHVTFEYALPVGEEDRAFEARLIPVLDDQYVAVVRDITERRNVEVRLNELNRELVVASRQAGMAEIATGVLHNVGNVLNSVNVSAAIVNERVRQSRSARLERVAELVREHLTRSGGPGADDPETRRLLDYVGALTKHLAEERSKLLEELGSLMSNVEHIKEIVAMQQANATAGGVLEMLDVTEVVEDALRFETATLEHHGVEVVRDYAEVPKILTDRHKILQILVNLIRNARHALDDGGSTGKRLVVRVSEAGGGVHVGVIDNGVGIPEDNLQRLFQHGFTTRPDGHGFGLHGAALATGELGGSLTARSDGPGTGATFTLELPGAVAEAA